MRTKRIFAHTAVHTAPKLFILIIVLLELDPVLLPQLVRLPLSRSFVYLWRPERSYPKFTARG